MSLKSLVLGAIAVVGGTILFTGVQIGIDEAVAPKMVYQNRPLPSFKQEQDYTQRRYLAMVRLETAKGGFFCSGTVISDDYVLTAAHCLMRGHVFPSMSLETIDVTSIQNPDGSKKTVAAHAAALNNRADYALIKGDFREFTKAKILVKPDMFKDVIGPGLTCGFPWGAEDVCYPMEGGIQTSYEHFASRGRMYPGMSGGPVVDAATHNVFAINTAVGEGYIITSPLIGLFETLGVEVVQ